MLSMTLETGSLSGPIESTLPEPGNDFSLGRLHGPPDEFVIASVVMEPTLPVEGDGQRADAPEEARPEPRFFRDLLLFEFASALYAVPASRAVGVVPFRKPVPVPGVDPRVHGVIQDRGRIIMVLAHPAGRVGVVDSATTPTRVVICTTERGLIGLPALATRAVGRVELDAEPSAFGVCTSNHGAFTYLDPEGLTESGGFD
jgi:hypothetical protein